MRLTARLCLEFRCCCVKIGLKKGFVSEGTWYGGRGGSSSGLGRPRDLPKNPSSRRKKRERKKNHPSSAGQETETTLQRFQTNIAAGRNPVWSATEETFSVQGGASLFLYMYVYKILRLYRWRSPRQVFSTESQTIFPVKFTFFSLKILKLISCFLLR